jgi:putative ATP-dependent endonuclease of OLD family
MQLTELRIRNFRGIKALDLTLGQSTVIIGENNTGKSTVLAAIRYALEQGRNRRAPNFDEFDYHLTTAVNDPHAAPPIAIDLIFAEPADQDWPDDVVQALNDVISLGTDDIRRIWLRVSSQWDNTLVDFATKSEFLDKDGNALQGKGASPFNLNRLQKLRPVFYLSALRDAGKEFSKQSQFWGSFVRGSTIAPELKTELENELSAINSKVVQAHQPFENIKNELSRIRDLVPTSNLADVSVEAIPGRLFDMLSKTQVNITSSTGAKVPIAKHGEGTQSLSVLLLFDAFLKSRLVLAYDRATTPIIAIEEPEAHLHPCAIRTLWKTIASLSGQKIASSHSGDMLAEVPVELVRRLYRKAGDVHAGQLKPNTLNAAELRMFNHHVRTSRGELLFANSWLLCEGESEVILFRRCAELMGADLPRWGVRIVEYRSGTDIRLYLKVANDLGITWHCFADNDTQGTADQAKVRAHLNGKVEADHLTVMPEPDLEQHLVGVGLLHIYEAELSPQLARSVTSQRGTATYPAEVARVVSNAKKKPEIIEKVMADIESRGVGAIPAIISTAIRKSVALAGGTLQ